MQQDCQIRVLLNVLVQIAYTVFHLEHPTLLEKVRLNRVSNREEPLANLLWMDDSGLVDIAHIVDDLTASNAIQNVL